MALERNRIVWLDTAKAIGIFLIVLGHTPLPSYLTKVLFAFHVPLFFFLSGVTFPTKQKIKEKNISIAKYAKKNFMAICVPYFSICAFTYLFWVFVGRNYGADALLHISPLHPLIGIFYSVGVDNYLVFNMPMWFLTCLFCAKMMLFLVKKMSSSFISYAVCVFMFFGAGLLYSRINMAVRPPWSIDVALIAVFFLFLGEFSGWKKVFPKKMYIATPFFLMILLVIAWYNDAVDMMSNHYGNVFLFLLGSFSGIVLVVCVSKILPGNRIILFLGQNSLLIMALHNIVGTLLKGVLVFGLKYNLDNFSNAIVLNIMFSIASIFLLIPCVVFFNNKLPFLIGKYTKS